MKSNLRVLPAVLLIGLFAVFLTACGGGGGGSGNGGGDTGTLPELTVNDVIFTEVTSTETPILAIATDKNAEEVIGVLVERDAAGNPVKITGAAYVSAQGEAGMVEIGSDGLPTSFTDSSGNRITFENYTDNTVDLSLYNVDGNLIEGPLAIEIDVNKLAEIQSLYNSIDLSAASQIGGIRTIASLSETIRFISLKTLSVTASWAGCTVSILETYITLGLTIGSATASCSSALLNTVAKLTAEESLEVASTLTSGVLCLSVPAGNLLGIFDCLAVLADEEAKKVLQDITAPSVPDGLTATAVFAGQIDLSWEASTDNVGVVGYKIYRDGVDVGLSANASYSDTGLSETNSYCYTVSAYDAAGNESGQGGQACTTTISNIPPIATIISPLNGSSFYAGDMINFQGTGADSDGTIVSYDWDFGDGSTSTLQNTSHSYTSTGAYTVALTVTDDDGATGDASINITIGSLSDINPPSVPTDLTATAVSSSQIDLLWSASTDDAGVAGYMIYREGSYLKAVTGTSASDTGLSPDTPYCYTVSAYDIAGNESGLSTEACAITDGTDTYTISGTVYQFGCPNIEDTFPVPNATVSLSGAATGTTTTDSAGNYSFLGLANGTYTVTTSGALMPVSKTVTVNGADITGVDLYKGTYCEF